MGGAERKVDYAPHAHNVEIHFSRIFDGRTPVLCGASGVPCPASNEWRYVSCAACLEHVVHARRAANDVALCGAAPDRGRSTQRRSEVTCDGCTAEVESRRRQCHGTRFHVIGIAGSLGGGGAQ